MTWCCCCCSVAQSCLTLCYPLACSMLGFPVLHYLSGICSNSCPLSQWCHPTISSSVAPFSSCPPSSPASESFPMSRLFTSGGQSIGASASASVLLINIQGWFPLGFSGLVKIFSVGKESACNAENTGLIPGSGRSTGGGIGYPLQDSWASLVAQLVKNLPDLLLSNGLSGVFSSITVQKH